MEEIRIFSRWKLWLFFLLLGTVNLYLFWHAQENTYSLRASWSGVDRREYIGEYQKQLVYYRGWESSEILADMEEKAEEYAATGNLENYPLGENVRQNMLLPLVEYQNGYEEYLETVQENAKRLGSVALFSDAGAFSSKNLNATAEDFARMEGISLQLGNYYGVTAYLEHNLTDYLVVLLVPFVVISFMEERQNGFWEIIRVCKRGRGNLALKRGVLLLLFTALTVLLFHLSVLSVSCHYFGEVEWNAAAASIPEFQKLPVPWTIGEFFVQYLAVKTMGICFIALLIWFILSGISEMAVAVISVCGIACVEYLMFALIPTPSIWNLWKYFNLFSIFHLSSLYCKYLNINLLGMPVNSRELFVAALPLLLIMLFVGVVFLNAKKRSEKRRGIWYALQDIKQKKVDWILSHFRGIFFELYKGLFIQKGFIVLVVLVLLLGRMYPFFEASRPGYQSIEQKYLEEWFGPVNDPEIQEKMKQEEKNIQEEFIWYQDIQEQYHRGERTAEELQIAGVLMESTQNRQKAYEKVRERVGKMEQRQEQMKSVPWIMEETFFDRLLGKEFADSQRKPGMIAMLFLVLLVSGGYSLELETGMADVTRSTSKGRYRMSLRKQGMVGLTVALLWLFCYGADWLNVIRSYPARGWEAPIQSIPEMLDLSWRISIREYIFLVYGLRLLVLWSAAQIILWISVLCRRKQSSMLLSFGIFVLPFVLWELGTEVFQKINISWYANVMEVMGECQYAGWRIALIYGSIAGVGLLAGIVSSICWSNNKNLGK